MGWYRTVAKTYQAYVIRAVIGSILSSSQINRYTLLEKEFLYGKRNHLTKMISDRLEWLANNIPREYNTCWTCRTRGKHNESFNISLNMADVNYIITIDDRDALKALSDMKVGF